MNKLFHAVLGSGSSGNSYVFYDGESSIIIDQGFSFVKFKSKLESFNIPLESVKAILLTHFHPDHSNGLRTTSNRLNIPLYIHKMAIEKEPVVFKRLNLPLDRIIEIDVNNEINIGNFMIRAFSTYHDSGGSVGYFIDNRGEKITLITDTGKTDEKMLYYANKSDILFLESNYDEEMLLNGPYPYNLKNRVKGNWGHLSNNQALSFVRESNFNGEYIYLIHLSDKNNEVSLVKDVFNSEFKIPNIVVCPRGELVNVIESKTSEK